MRKHLFLTKCKHTLSTRGSYVLSCFSHVQLFETPWTVAHLAPLPIGFSRQEYWSGLPFPSPRDLQDQGIEPMSLLSPELAGRFFTTSAPWEARRDIYWGLKAHTVHLWLLTIHQPLPNLLVLVPRFSLENKSSHHSWSLSSSQRTFFPPLRPKQELRVKIVHPSSSPGNLI